MTQLHVCRYIWSGVLSCALHAPLRWSTVSPVTHPALPVALLFTISVIKYVIGIILYSKKSLDAPEAEDVCYRMHVGIPGVTQEPD